MNERIKQLALDAGIKFVLWDDSGRPMIANYTPEEQLAEFAELIVKECAEQIIAKGTDWVDFAPSQTGVRPEYWAMAQQIKEHFGVDK